MAAYLQKNVVLAFGTGCALSAVFLVRYIKTRKVMPAVVLGAISLAFTVLFKLAF